MAYDVPSVNLSVSTFKTSSLNETPLTTEPREPTPITSAGTPLTVTSKFAFSAFWTVKSLPLIELKPSPTSM
jgi:hypothetical protein